MNTNDLNTALYEKMAAEQDKYRDWLKSQPPEEILHHTYEYTIREDIVMAMEELELTDAQAQALDAVAAYTQTFNKMGFIETEERDEIYMALRGILDALPDGTLQKDALMEKFEQLRDF